MGMTVVPKGAIAFNNTSGLAEPGGVLDRLMAAMDNRDQYQGTLRGLAPALQNSGIPVAAPSPSILSQITGGIGGFLGLSGQQAPPQMPVATANLAGGNGAAPPTMGGPAPQGQPASAAPAGSGGFMPVFANAIAGIESAGSGGYDATGPVTKSGDQALGKYQVMASNVGPWTQEVLGQKLTPEQFLASPQAQDAVFNGKFGQYLQQTGNPQDAASMWFTGKPYAQGAAAQDQLGTTGAGYVAKFMAALPGGGGAGGGAQGGMPAGAMAYAPGGSGDTTPMPQATATGPQPPQSAVQANSNQPGAGQPGGTTPQAGTTASPGAVLGPLMANPATRQIGGQLWQSAMQQGGGGGMPGTMNLPAGMTPQALAAMISEPATMQMGLAIWQKGLFPQITSVEPNRAIFRGTQYIGQSPSGPITAHQGDVILNPNTGGTIAAVPPDLQHAEIGRDAYGQPVYGAFNPRGGATTPFPNAQGASAGAATGPDGQPLSGDAFLGTLPPALAGQVKAIADGRIKLPSGMGAANPMAQRIRAMVLQYDPSFDQAGVDARFETRADFAKGDAAKTITAGNTALIHLGELAAQADKLGNADTTIPGNNAYNYLKNQANASSAAGGPLASFNATASKYVEEATKFYRGTGGTEGDITRDMLNISPNMSPTQLKAAIGAQIPLIAGKIAAMQDRWRQGMGPKAGDYPILSPQAQAVLGRLGPQAAPGAGPAAGNLPVAAPGGGGAAAPAGGVTKTIRGVTYTQGPDGHWYTGQ